LDRLFSFSAVDHFTKKRGYVTPSEVEMGKLEYCRVSEHRPFARTPHGPSCLYVFLDYLNSLKKDEPSDEETLRGAEFVREIRRGVTIPMSEGRVHSWGDGMMRKYEIAQSGVLSLILSHVLSDVDVVHQMASPTKVNCGLCDVGFIYPRKVHDGNFGSVIGCVELKKKGMERMEMEGIGGCTPSIAQGLGYISNFSAYFGVEDGKNHQHCAYLLIGIDGNVINVCGAWDSGQINGDRWWYDDEFGQEGACEKLAETKWCILNRITIPERSGDGMPDDELIKEVARTFHAMNTTFKTLSECKRDDPWWKPCPMKMWNDVDLMGTLNNGIKAYGPNVLRVGNLILKRYDYHMRGESEYRRGPNLEIMGEISEYYLEGMKVTTPVEGNYDIQFLEYKFLEGSMFPKSAHQFGVLCKQISKLHERSYVHGDIRFANFVFGEDKDDVHIIDFDYAGCHNVKKYPPGYNWDLMERKECPWKGKALLIEHDRFSLRECFKHIMFGSLDSCQDILLLFRSMENNLDKIGQMIMDKNPPISRSYDTEKVDTHGTGSPAKDTLTDSVDVHSRSRGRELTPCLDD
jgi:hypothetical protein